MRPTTLLQGLDPQIDPGVREEAQALAETFADVGVKPLALSVGDASVLVPEQLSHVLVKIINQLASGSAVGVFTIPEELTTTTAAAQLGVSRPTLMKMIREGKINSHKVGSHARLKREDVVSCLEARAESRTKALEQMLQDGADFPN